LAIKHTFKVAGKDKTRILTKAKAIRFFCVDCMGGHLGEVLKCTSPKCPLFPFRFGNERGLNGNKKMRTSKTTERRKILRPIRKRRK